MCFIGIDAVDWMVLTDNARDIADAVEKGNAMIDLGIITHVSKQHP
jgi:hypothetical protein